MKGAGAGTPVRALDPKTGEQRGIWPSFAAASEATGIGHTYLAAAAWDGAVRWGLRWEALPPGSYQAPPAPPPAGTKRGPKFQVDDLKDPLLRLIFREMNERNYSFEDVADGSGVAAATLRRWKYISANYSYHNVLAVLQFLGIDLVPVRKAC